MRFTILTSCHNNAPHLKDYYRSIQWQKYPNLEVIFVDDASTDNSLSIAKSWTNNRVKVLHSKEHLHCGGAYNLALKHATGDIIGVVDADDILLKGAVQVIVKEYRKHPEIDFIYTQHYWCDEQMRRKRTGLSSLPIKRKSLVEMAQLGKHCFSHWRTCRTKLRDRAEIFPRDLKWSVDKNMGFVLEEIGHGGFFPAVLYSYRYHKKNMSLTKASHQKKTTQRLAQEFMDRRKSKGIVAKRIVRL